MFSSSTKACTQRAPVIKRARRDAYAREQARLKAVANQSRTRTLEQQRKIALGDPVRGVETPFVASFDSPPAIEASETESASRHNFYVNSEELDAGMARSKYLLSPSGMIGGQQSIQNMKDGRTPEERQQELDEKHKRAEEALKRISNLSLGSSKDRLRVNKQRCVQTFGRHNTDNTLERLSTTTQSEGDIANSKPRAGPDTGSSEVQVGILTAKIRVLTKFIEGRGRMDKTNRRNLQLLVHRRQKHLRYLQKKDKGGARWQNLVSTLGLTDGTWKGEITVPRYLA